MGETVLASNYGGTRMKWIIWFFGLMVVAPLDVMTLLTMDLSGRWTYFCEFELGGS